MKLIEILKKRRSIRNYTGEKIDDKMITQILQAGLLSASSRGRQPWEFIVVRDKGMLEKMSFCRKGSADMLKQAEAAIVVVANEDITDVWVEDCSIAMSNMHLMADSLGLGSCWIQGRLRIAADGTQTEEYLRGLLGYPANYKLEAMLSLGIAKNHPEPYSLDELDMSKVHYDHWRAK